MDLLNSSPYHLDRWIEKARQSVKDEYGNRAPSFVEPNVQKIAYAHYKIKIKIPSSSELETASRTNTFSKDALRLMDNVFNAHHPKDAFNAALKALRLLRERFGTSVILWQLTESAIGLGMITDIDVIQASIERRTIFDTSFRLCEDDRRAFPQYFHRDFLPLPGSQGLPAVNLGSYIHPIFDRNNFSVEIDHDSIKLALKLASRILTTRAMTPFWWKMLFAREERMSGRPDAVLIRPRDRSLTPSEIADVESRLDLLKTCIIFQEDRTTQGATCTPHPRSRAAKPFGGHQSTIQIAFQDLLHAAIPPGQTPGYFALLASLRLALNLVHEISHAAAMASRGNPLPCYHKDAFTTEEGYESEVKLFGGRINSDFTASEFPKVPSDVEPLPTGLILAIDRWPARRTILIYEQNPMGPNIGLRDGRHSKTEDIIHPIVHPRRWVYSLFTEQLWQRVGRDGPSAVRPPVRKAYIVRGDIPRYHHLEGPYV